MSKLRHLMVTGTFFLSHYVHASLDQYEYYPETLVKSVETLAKQGSLKQNLRIVISNDQRADMTYKIARRYLFGQLHLQTDSAGNYYVKDKYCNIKYTEKHSVGPNRIPNANYLNCEHTWPQSRFNPSFSKEMQRNDLHHLFPVKSNVNSVRSNNIFGEVHGEIAARDCEDSRKGTINYKNESSKAFEPPTNHRGDVARALFYFSVRYNSPISESEEYYLRRWHREDPVSQEEMKRNEEIFKIQNNRNPFIDDETLVSQIKDF